MAEIKSAKVADDQKLPDELNIKLESLRCVSCNRFIMYYALIEGTIAIKCRRCHCWNVVDARSIDNDGKKP